MPELTGQAKIDDVWQKGIRDIFLPKYYAEWAHQGRYVFADKGKLALEVQARVVDTILQGKDGEMICVEEKIVRPREGELYDHFFLELKWMSATPALPSITDYLLYCFLSKDGNALDCWRMKFPELLNWFWAHEGDKKICRPIPPKPGNNAEGRMVPIDAVVKATSGEHRRIEWEPTP